MNRRALLILVPLLLLPLSAGAQYQVLHGTFANGGGVAAGDHTVYATAGQPAIGMSFGGSNIVKAGFWYCAGLSSTVEVAFASFHAELRDDAVRLSWAASSSAPFESFDIYRSETDEEGFARLNAEPLRAGGDAEYVDATALAGKTYLYRVAAVSGPEEWRSQTVSIAIPPKPTTLYQNYPNPFNPATTIAFYLPSQARVTLAIYDVSGARIRTLMSGVRPPGRQVATWDGRNDSGLGVCSGVYYYRLAAGKDVITRKLVIVR